MFVAHCFGDRDRAARRWTGARNSDGEPHLARRRHRNPRRRDDVGRRERCVGNLARRFLPGDRSWELHVRPGWLGYVAAVPDTAEHCWASRRRLQHPRHRFRERLIEFCVRHGRVIRQHAANGFLERAPERRRALGHRCACRFAVGSARRYVRGRRHLVVRVVAAQCRLVVDHQVRRRRDERDDRLGHDAGRERVLRRAAQGRRRGRECRDLEHRHRRPGRQLEPAGSAESRRQLPDVARSRECVLLPDRANLLRHVREARQLSGRGGPAGSRRPAARSRDHDAHRFRRRQDVRVHARLELEVLRRLGPDAAVFYQRNPARSLSLRRLAGVPR